MFLFLFYYFIFITLGTVKDFLDMTQNIQTQKVDTSDFIKMKTICIKSGKRLMTGQEKIFATNTTDKRLY